MTLEEILLEFKGGLLFVSHDRRFMQRLATRIIELASLIMRGDRVGLIGPNGVGKTTLLKILLGELVKHGTKLSITYFDQLRAQLDPEETVVDAIAQGHEMITINGHKKPVLSKRLFLCPGTRPLPRKIPLRRRT